MIMTTALLLIIDTSVGITDFLTECRFVTANVSNYIQLQCLFHPSSYLLNKT